MWSYCSSISCFRSNGESGAGSFLHVLLKFGCFQPNVNSTVSALRETGNRISLLGFHFLFVFLSLSLSRSWYTHHYTRHNLLFSSNLKLFLLFFFSLEGHSDLVSFSPTITDHRSLTQFVAPPQWRNWSRWTNPTARRRPHTRKWIMGKRNSLSSLVTFSFAYSLFLKP